jgi:hypothetical protein
MNLEPNFASAERAWLRESPEFEEEPVEVITDWMDSVRKYCNEDQTPAISDAAEALDALDQPTDREFRSHLADLMQAVLYDFGGKVLGKIINDVMPDNKIKTFAHVPALILIDGDVQVEWRKL